MLANHETINKIIERCDGDKEVLEMLEQIIKSFQQYHAAIYELELKMKLYGHGGIDRDEYNDLVSRLDSSRTIHHNAAITNVRILNRIASQYGLPPFYDGVISEEKPYRRELGNAVLEYVETVVRNRI